MRTGTIVGYLLLGIGVGIILWALYVSYGIFTGAQNPPEVFSMPAPEQIKTPAQKKTTQLSPEELQQQLGSLLEQQLKEFLPFDALPKTLNLFSWSVFVGILIFGGSQLAGLGIRLLKTG